MSLNKILLLIVLSTGVARVSSAADEDDFYAEATASLSANRAQSYFTQAQVGYCPWNEVGLGFVFDQLRVKDPDRDETGGVRGSIEAKWFLEPFEFSADLGIMSRTFHLKENNLSPVASLDAAYLLALTPALAAKFTLQVLIIDSANVPVFAGIGVRALF